jgi:arylsulfatase
MVRTVKILLLGTALVVLAFGLFVFAVTEPGAVSPRPSIVFIMADDMGYSDLGSYGGEVATPHLDRMAAQGIKLRSFYNNARCCPTRASLLTGQYPHTVGMGKMVTMPEAQYEPGSYQGFLDPSYPTVAEELKKSGYRTYMSGKWHVGEREAHWPLKRGFERYFGLISGASSFYEITPQEKAKRRFLLDDKDYTIPKEGFYATDAFTDHAIGYLNDHKKNSATDPFFLYLAYTAPHFPLHALEEDIKKYETLYLQGWDALREERFQKMKALGYADARYQLSPKTKGIPSWEDSKEKQVWARKMAVYAAMIDRMDQNIGRLMETLKRNNQYDNTLVVFLSDNGACAEEVRSNVLHDPSKKIGERGSYMIYGESWANASNTPFKEYKHYMHEGGIATPCIIQWPAGIQPLNGFVDGVGHVMDLMPTALELAGISTTALPGNSLSYLWNGKKHPDRTYCWEHEGNKAIRKGKWKLVKEHKDLAWELYDMQADPVEMRNLAAQLPKRAQALLQEYQAWEKQVGVRELPAK